MSKPDYAALRLDPRWQRCRLLVMERDGFKCVDCNDAEKTLNVHHDYYVTGRMPWDYPMFSLSTLCRECHQERHQEPADGEVSSVLLEWEIELDWIFRGKPGMAGRFWYAAGQIASIMDTGMSEVEVYDFIYKKLSTEEAKRLLPAPPTNAASEGEAPP